MGKWQALTAAVENVVFSYEEGMPDGFHLLLRVGRNGENRCHEQWIQSMQWKHRKHTLSAEWPIFAQTASFCRNLNKAVLD
jgi:hypothetical protein